MAMPPASIDELMQAAVSGNSDAFGELALLVQDRLYRFVLAQGLPPDQAGEAVQETLLRAYKSRSRWRQGRGATPWLYGIAMNVVREQRRSRKRVALGLDVEQLAVAAELDTTAERIERLRAVSAAMERLPRRQREAVACRHLRQLSVRATAGIMGVAEGTVKAATAAGIAKLREIMGDKI